MNLADKKDLESFLRIMDLINSKPNYSALAREYGVDYRTIKKYHLGYEGKPKNRNKPSKLDPYLDIIKVKFEIDRTTRKATYEFLIDKYGFEAIGTYSNFKAYCKKHKLKPASRYKGSGGGTRFETNEGELAECDWKEDIHLISKQGEEFVVNIFHLVLKFSRYSYIELTLSKEQKTVFRCLINAFFFYGGVPKRILFDNMSTVINTTTRPKKVNSKMVQFARDMNFKVDSCKARHAYTKGTNEARNKILDWIRPYDGDFETFEELQEVVEKINVKMNTEVCQGTGMSPCLLFLKEKEYLTPLPNAKIVDQYTSTQKIKVSGQQLVYYKGSQYSVDRSLIGEYVQPEEFDSKLLLYYKGKLIQVHPLINGGCHYTDEHYKQSLRNTVKPEKLDEIVRNNLSIMDQLLEKRQVTVTKEDACRSNDALLAYLTTHGSQSSYIRRFIQSLNKSERSVFFEEMKKLLPYIVNEEQFFLAFKHAVNKDDLQHVRVRFWYLDLIGNYDLMNQEGYDVIYRDFEKETEEYMEELNIMFGGENECDK